MQKLLVFFAGLLLSLSASAGVPVRKWQTGWEPSPIQAGRDHAARYYPHEVIVRSFGLPGTEVVVGVSRSRAEFWFCPLAQPRLNLATEMCEEGQPDICSEKIGTSAIVNVTSGWKRTPKVNDESEEWVYTYRFPPSGTATICGGSDICEMTIDAREPCTECGAYVSQVAAANGLHRVSTDFRGHFTGKTCNAASESDLPPEAVRADNSKDPPCPGYVGEVNGVRGCYGTASNPVRPVPPPEKPSGHGQGDAGNPAAGTKPSSGEGSGSGGSGRTPSAGAGGSGGGPSGAAAGSGTKPDGTTPKPDDGKEQAACGAPGQPKCSINEAGTPDGKSAFDSANTGLDQNKDGWLAEISKVKDLTAPGWTWTFQLPSGCTPLDVPAFNLSLDVCRFQPIIHDIMSMLWAIATVMGCALMVFNATGKN